MKKNMGSTDKLIRVIIAIIVAVLYFTGTLTGTIGIIALVIASVFFVTSLSQFLSTLYHFGNIYLQEIENKKALHQEGLFFYHLERIIIQVCTRVASN
jgi:uncharacterized membrane protein YtjA (UPF0391 family)